MSDFWRSSLVEYLRLSRSVPFSGLGRIELLLDVLNVLNDTAEEAWPPTICSARISARHQPARNGAEPSTPGQPRESRISFHTPEPEASSFSQY